MPGIIELKEVHKIYKLGSVSVNALNGINLVINKGEFISIVGPSGSGKTTMLNLIGLLDRPTAGKVFFESRDVSSLSDNELSRLRAEKIGFVFQTFNLIPSLTAKENVELAAAFSNKVKDPERKAEELLELMDLKSRMNHKPNQLSGGEQQRVAIARALMNDPLVLLADEPTGNLDSKTSMELLEIFKKLNSEGLTLVVVTHNLSIANEAGRIIYLKDGRVENEVKKGY
ncbi:MAG TPA: ABC transporter ATP-binding protein [Geobacterales bacterium]|nr:ABC transporter ATP-binding protein [Geobacterales bacterium]